MKALSIRIQVLILILFLVFICVPSLIFETKGLLDWIDTFLAQNNSNIENDQAKGIILKLLSLNSYALTIELKKYLKTTEIMSNLLQKINSAYLISSNSEAVFSNTIKNENKIYEDFGVFYSKYYPKLSEQGLEVVNSSKAMNLIFPNIMHESITWMYFGFEVDEILFIYPGVVMPLGYTHTVREWYYQAFMNQGKYILTEPYIDAITNRYVITSSKTIERNNKIYAVAAVDITCDHMKQLVNTKTELLGLITILSTIKGAMIVNPWNYKLETRIFQEDITGFSKSLWDNITGVNFYDYNSFEFSTINKIAYFCYRKLITPYNDITHILIMCINTSNLKDYTSKESKFISKSYLKIFYGVIITLSSASFLNILINLYFSSKLAKSLIDMHKYAKKLIFGALTKSFNYQILKFETKKYIFPINPLFECFNCRIDNIQKLERFFSNYKWGKIRPSDFFLYKSRISSCFPINTIGFKVKRMRHLFIQCTTIIIIRNRRCTTYSANGLINCDILSLVNEPNELEKIDAINNT
ncbi:hypothetical protein SteCoe_32480 [Stentor coeruleus]|uniref:Cache domain-containing protein n=1 Tax=Stentor coeruleus TaxID=5963 RepID=A0A1R2AZ01_9CILI|nr:hypothetical protein SteCoe_32480 [Stentor coeruleus]